MEGVYVGLKKENYLTDFSKNGTFLCFQNVSKKCRKSAKKSAEL